MTLADLQRRFFRLITAPENVAAELPAAAATEPGIAPLTGWIRADDEAMATQRLDVYANMYFFRLLEVVRDDYPKLAALVGADRFHNLVTSYLQAYPSANPSIRWVGRHLARHIEDSEPELLARHPPAAALARLEWARGEAFDAAGAPAVTVADLAAVPPDRWPLLRFKLRPAVRVVELSHAVLPLWLALEQAERAARAGAVASTAASTSAAFTPPDAAQPAAAPAPAELPAAPAADPPVCALIWRHELKVWHRSLPPPEREALAAAADHASFAELCERLHRHAGDDTPSVAAGYLRDWVESGMVAGYDLPPPPA